MDVAASNFDEMERRNLVLDDVYHPAYSCEGQEETDGSHEKTPSRSIGNALMDYAADGCPMEQQKHQCRSADHEQQYEPRVRHAILDKTRVPDSNPGGSEVTRATPPTPQAEVGI